MCRPPFRSRCMADTDGKRSAAIAKGRRRRLEAEAVPGGGVREEAPLLQRRRKGRAVAVPGRSEEHTSELQSLMRNSYAVFCLKKQHKKLQHKIQETVTNITG